MPQVRVHIIIDDVNGQDADVMVVHELLAGSHIPDTIRRAAVKASDEALDRMTPRLRKVTIDIDGKERREGRTGKVSSL